MNLKLISTIATAAASLPIASAIYEGPGAKSGDGPAVTMIQPGEQQTGQGEQQTGQGSRPDDPSDSEVTITNLIAPEVGNRPLDQNEVSITSIMPGNSNMPPVEGEVVITATPETTSNNAAGGQPIPELYQDSLDNEVSTTNNSETTLSNDAGKIQPLPELYQESLLVGPTWVAIKYYDASKDELLDVADGTTITLEFEEDGRFDGNAGCNNYFGSFGPSLVTRSSVDPLDGASFTVAGPLGTTMMMCESAVMDQESTYLANFNGTISFSTSDGASYLRLTDADTDNVIAEYTLFIPLILDQTWTATKFYNNDEGGLVDVIPGSAITLKMEVNERLDGSAGCNTYIGAYDDLTSTSFSIAGPVGSTKIFCDEPDNIMEQERLYLENFEDGSDMKWTVLADGSLELRDSITDDVIALYTAGLEADADPLSTSSGMAVGTAVGAFAMATAMLFV